MPAELATFAYEAASPSGERVKARMQAASASEVAETLAADGWVPISITPVRTGRLHTDIGALFGGGLRLPVARRALLARQLHQLLVAGITLPRALQVLGDTDDVALARACADLSDQVTAGVPLSEAMADPAYRKAFDDVFIAYIAAGEESGTLVETTDQLAIMLEKQASLRRKIASVTAYPILVSIVIAVIVTGIMVFLVPQYARIYADVGAELPRPTQLLVTLSSYFLPLRIDFAGEFPFVFRRAGDPWWASPVNVLSPVLWGMVVVGILFHLYLRTRDDLDVGERLDRIRFKLPLFGKLWRKTVLYRWSSTLGSTLSAGVRTEEALTLAARASGSRWVLKITLALADAVRGGRPMSTELNHHPDLFDANVRAMISTGEQTGEIDTMLEHTAKTLSEEIETIISGLGAKIEVVLILTMGVIVGGLLVVLYLPIIGLALNIGEVIENQNQPPNPEGPTTTTTLGR